ncbi:hypothetical protein X798_01712 [Onchocerca flexuosa]|uniref:Uncharacterized protein n=1 Tax=Onchocerca flexuosa TaxID=387005 RepID=A0A238C2D3_9BILA|nr:hypothetical protein X798_01712 [Onchocerca flexuosa]
MATKARQEHIVFKKNEQHCERNIVRNNPDKLNKFKKGREKDIFEKIAFDLPQAQTRHHNLWCSAESGVARSVQFGKEEEDIFGLGELLQSARESSKGLKKRATAGANEGSSTLAKL